MTVDETALKCSECGRICESYADMYCTLSGRGANSYCKNHKDKLVCGNCAQKYLKSARARTLRIQRKRTKGWRMPPDTVYVGRPTKWGNPYLMKPKSQFTREQAIETYENYIKRVLVEHPDFLDPLKGKDLACWCPLDLPCHVDVILKLLKEAEQKNE